MRNNSNNPRQFLGLIIWLLAYLLVGVKSQQNQTNYVPRDALFLNCGGPNSTDSDGRKWISDSSFATAATAAVQKPDVPQVPYMTARVSSSNFTYSFPVGAPGRIFLRLHLYSASYNGLNGADALFSATAGAYTLLRNFSAAQAMEALNSTHIIREFSLHIQPGQPLLNITFAPSVNSYAFVNGIELVSHPDIFTTGPTAVVVGQSSGFQIDNATAMENVYRLNVGGNAIKASHDNGLFRSWGNDLNYLFSSAASGVSEAPDPNVTVGLPPGYVAPRDLYTTLRSMGPFDTVNQQFNLTWLFTLDSGFSYLVRLHFCETSSVIDKENQRVFSIFLNNRTAEAVADVIAWAGGNGLPIHRDYVVLVPPGPPQQRLRLDLHPNTASKPQYYNAILNGLEIFKINDTRGNLGGQNPILPPKSDVPSPSKPPSKNHSAAIAGGAGAGAGAAALLVLVFVVCVVSRRQSRKRGEAEGWLTLSHYGNSPSLFSASGSTATNLCRHFSIAEIKAATNDFDESLLLGLGGFGKVYSGEIEGGIKVAIKRGNPQSEQGVHEFQTEIEMLSKLRHGHLVSLIGFCQEKSEMILVYDYMANGTLREHLYGDNLENFLSWKQRLEICIGAARGLHYLHTGAKQTIIHRDVKTTNILLDHKWVAKVSDFGLSKMGPSVEDTHVSTLVKGSFGYLDPEYYRRQRLTQKSDVYSFGVVLFEVLCARPPLIRKLPKEQVSLAEWAQQCYNQGTLHRITDPCLVGEIAAESFNKFAETAAKCVDEVGMERPSMGDVLWNLEFALQLQESAEEEELTDANNVGVDVDVDVDSSSLGFDSKSSGFSRSLASQDSTALTPTAVFSQTMSADGRL